MKTLFWTLGVRELQSWVVAGPEFSEFSEFSWWVWGRLRRRWDSLDRHHKQTNSVQEKFAHDVLSLVTPIEELRNPFTEESLDLLNRNFKAVAHAREGCKSPEEYLFAGESQILPVPIHRRAFQLSSPIRRQLSHSYAQWLFDCYLLPSGLRKVKAVI